MHVVLTESHYPWIPSFYRSTQREYVLEALRAGKHVLLNDPLSTSMSEFEEQQRVAKSNGKMIQFLTMFVHQFKTKKFLNSVLGDPEFGRIHSIVASLNMCYDDVQSIGVKLPLRRGDGSIRVLSRYCVLVGTLFFSQVGSYAESVKVEKIVQGREGQITSATCVVRYSQVSAMDHAHHFQSTIPASFSPVFPFFLAGSFASFPRWIQP